MDSFANSAKMRDAALALYVNAKVSPLARFSALLQPQLLYLGRLCNDEPVSLRGKDFKPTLPRDSKVLEHAD